MTMQAAVLYKHKYIWTVQTLALVNWPIQLLIRFNTTTIRLPYCYKHMHDLEAQISKISD